ncbi:arsenite efflux ATP-binding protein ArsA [Jatrophihabitans sp. GAS493]|uniref:ArsA-related P-loop ATPase n=1 Tax=Jatrophihabitans sp. GAS493 TaxID=1907575 RepID=UPI000BB87180|nr:ArsA-related P-loop ATPase [Jatrophihabitans sp. GAS493]SOD71886.1 arsenite efflux ATP-binding protein ArsA [Jatrophihabitans sp. GAS493]
MARGAASAPAASVDAATAPRSLAPGISSAARLHIVTGKGGTGKTTVAAALAMALARGKRRVLLIEVEGRQAFAQLFDVPALPYAEHQLATVAGGGTVVGLAIDPEEAFIDYLDMFYNLRRSARVLRKMGLIDFVTTLAPGVRDVLLTGKVKEAAVRSDGNGRPVYDAVVLDAPPTGRIRPFLEATTEVANLAKVGPINRQSKGVMDLLHSVRTSVHLVTLLEEMPVQETVEAAADLTGAGYQLGSVIVNRARPQLVEAGQVGADGSVDAASLARGLKGSNIDPALAGALAQQLAEYARHQGSQLANTEALSSIGAPRIVLPELAPPVTVGELHELSEYFLTAPSGGPNE